MGSALQPEQAPQYGRSWSENRAFWRHINDIERGQLWTQYERLAEQNGFGSADEMMRAFNMAVRPDHAQSYRNESALQRLLGMGRSVVNLLRGGFEETPLGRLFLGQNVTPEKLLTMPGLPQNMRQVLERDPNALTSSERAAVVHMIRGTGAFRTDVPISARHLPRLLAMGLGDESLNQLRQQYPQLDWFGIETDDADLANFNPGNDVIRAIGPVGTALNLGMLPLYAIATTAYSTAYRTAAGQSLGDAFVDAIENVQILGDPLKEIIGRSDNPIMQWAAEFIEEHPFVSEMILQLAHDAATYGMLHPRKAITGLFGLTVGRYMGRAVLENMAGSGNRTVSAMGRNELWRRFAHERQQFIPELMQQVAEATRTREGWRSMLQSRSATDRATTTRQLINRTTLMGSMDEQLSQASARHAAAELLEEAGIEQTARNIYDMGELVRPELAALLPNVRHAAVFDEFAPVLTRAGDVTEELIAPGSHLVDARGNPIDRMAIAAEREAMELTTGIDDIARYGLDANELNNPALAEIAVDRQRAIVNRVNNIIYPVEKEISPRFVSRYSLDPEYRAMDVDFADLVRGLGDDATTRYSMPDIWTGSWQAGQGTTRVSPRMMLEDIRRYIQSPIERHSIFDPHFDTYLPRDDFSRLLGKLNAKERSVGARLFLDEAGLEPGWAAAFRSGDHGMSVLAARIVRRADELVEAMKFKAEYGLHGERLFMSALQSGDPSISPNLWLKMLNGPQGRTLLSWAESGRGKFIGFSNMPSSYGYNTSMTQQAGRMSLTRQQFKDAYGIDPLYDGIVVNPFNAVNAIENDIIFQLRTFRNLDDSPYGSLLPASLRKGVNFQGDIDLQVKYLLGTDLAAQKILRRMDATVQHEVGHSVEHMRNPYARLMNSDYHPEGKLFSQTITEVIATAAPYVPGKKQLLALRELIGGDDFRGVTPFEQTRWLSRQAANNAYVDHVQFMQDTMQHLYAILKGTKHAKAVQELTNAGSIRQWIGTLNASPASLAGRAAEHPAARLRGLTALWLTQQGWVGRATAEDTAKLIADVLRQFSATGKKSGGGTAVSASSRARAGRAAREAMGGGERAGTVETAQLPASPRQSARESVTGPQTRTVRGAYPDVDARRREGIWLDDVEPAAIEYTPHATGQGHVLTPEDQLAHRRTYGRRSDQLMHELYYGDGVENLRVAPHVPAGPKRDRLHQWLQHRIHADGSFEIGSNFADDLAKFGFTADDVLYDLPVSVSGVELALAPLASSKKSMPTTLREAIRLSERAMTARLMREHSAKMVARYNDLVNQGMDPVKAAQQAGAMPPPSAPVTVRASHGTGAHDVGMRTGPHQAPGSGLTHTSEKPKRGRARRTGRYTLAGVQHQGPMGRVGMHFGTRDAAVQRIGRANGMHVEDLAPDKPYTVEGERLAERFMSAEIKLQRPLGSLDDPIDELWLGIAELKNDELIAAFRRKYDGIIYRNNVEDPGSISVVTWRKDAINIIDDRVGYNRPIIGHDQPQTNYMTTVLRDRHPGPSLYPIEARSTIRARQRMIQVNMARQIARSYADDEAVIRAMRLVGEKELLKMAQATRAVSPVTGKPYDMASRLAEAAREVITKDAMRHAIKTGDGLRLYSVFAPDIRNMSQTAMMSALAVGGLGWWALSNENDDVYWRATALALGGIAGLSALRQPLGKALPALGRATAKHVAPRLPRAVVESMGEVSAGKFVTSAFAPSKWLQAARRMPGGDEAAENMFARFFLPEYGYNPALIEVAKRIRTLQFEGEAMVQDFVRRIGHVRDNIQQGAVASALASGASRAEARAQGRAAYDQATIAMRDFAERNIAHGSPARPPEGVIDDAVRLFEGTLTPKQHDELLTLTSELLEKWWELGLKQVELGRFTQRTFDLRAGTYMPRFYLDLERNAFLHPDEWVSRTKTFLARNRPRSGFNVSEVGIRDDGLPYRVRVDELDEIRQLDYAVLRGMSRDVHDVAIESGFKMMRETPGVVHTEFDRALSVLRRTRQIRDGYDLNQPFARDYVGQGPHWQDLFASDKKQWDELMAIWDKNVRLAEGEVKRVETQLAQSTDSPNWLKLPAKKGLGSMSGRYVSREAYNFLQDFSLFGSPGAFVSGWNQFYSMWREMMTVFNVPTHVGNIGSNVFLATMAGMPLPVTRPWAWAGAFAEYSVGRSLGGIPTGKMAVTGGVYGGLIGSLFGAGRNPDDRKKGALEGFLQGAAMGAGAFGGVALSANALVKQYQKRFPQMTGEGWFRNGQWYKEARGAGLIGRGFLSDLQRQTLAEVASRWQTDARRLLTQIYGTDALADEGVTAFRQIASSVREGKLSAYGVRVRDSFRQAYQMEEELFKMAVFINERRGGASIEAAAKKANDWLVDYSQRSGLISLVRQGPLPFFTFSGKILPVLLKGIAQKPWLFGLAAAPFMAMEMGSQAIFGAAEMQPYGSRKLGPLDIRYTQSPFQPRGTPQLPESENTIKLGPLSWPEPFAAVKPVITEAGDLTFFGTGRMTPFGQFIVSSPAEMILPEWWPQAFMPSHPIIGLTSVFIARDPLTRDPLFHDLQTGPERGLIAARELSRVVLPSMISRNFWDMIASVGQSGYNRAGFEALGMAGLRPIVADQTGRVARSAVAARVTDVRREVNRDIRRHMRYAETRADSVRLARRRQREIASRVAEYLAELGRQLTRTRSGRPAGSR